MRVEIMPGASVQGSDVAETVYVKIRKVEFGDDGLVARKYALSNTNEWILVPEGGRYPEECIFRCRALPCLEREDDERPA